jgi:hypothetical protein
MHDLLDIKARLDAASPGPWRALTDAAFPMTLANNEYTLGEFSAWMSDGDRALIVNARRDIERLLNEVEYLQEHLAAVLAGAGDDQLCNDARKYLLRSRGTL